MHWISEMSESTRLFRHFLIIKNGSWWSGTTVLAMQCAVENCRGAESKRLVWHIRFIHCSRRFSISSYVAAFNVGSSGRNSLWIGPFESKNTISSDLIWDFSLRNFFLFCDPVTPYSGTYLWGCTSDTRLFTWNHYFHLTWVSIHNVHEVTTGIKPKLHCSDDRVYQKFIHFP